MTNLDSREEISVLDSKNILASIEKLPDQIEQGWEDLRSSSVPESCHLARNVVVSGMGGSALGGRIVDSLMEDKVRSPIEVFTQFRLPDYVNQNTFVILCSYSGNTEETLTVAREVLTRGASVFCITTGGKLKEFMEEHKLDGFVIDPKNNPSGQPRMGLGYSVIATLGALAKCGFINLLDSEVKEAVASAREVNAKFSVDVPTSQNAAKMIAGGLMGKIPVLVASEHLLGAAHAFKNQLNENAKTFANLFDIPELNHHLMEGLSHPDSLKEVLHFLFLESDYYSKEIQTRYPITYEVVEKQGIDTTIYKLTEKRKFPQIFEALILGSYISFYLAMLNGIDPAPIPWVDYFKDKLK